MTRRSINCETNLSRRWRKCKGLACWRKQLKILEKVFCKWTAFRKIYILKGVSREGFLFLTNSISFLSFFFLNTHVHTLVSACASRREESNQFTSKESKQLLLWRRKNIEIHKIRLVVLTACHTRRPKKKKKKSSCAAGPKMGDTLLKCKMTTLRAELVLF